MKTIEERAYEAVGYQLPKKGEMHTPIMLHNDEQLFVNGYIKGATDHHTIVCERVRKWICTNCECSENCEFSSPDNCPTIKSITKAMEGEE